MEGEPFRASFTSYKVSLPQRQEHNGSAFLSLSANLHVHLCDFQEAAGENAGVHGPAEDRKEKVPSPHLSQLVVLTNSGTLYGLAQRVVATESL